MNNTVDARTVGVVRSLVGLAAFVRAFEAGRLLQQWLLPTSMRAPLVDGFPAARPEILFLLVGVWGAAAAAFAAGWKTRWTGSVLTLVMSYTLLLDQQTYSNHLYLLILVTGLLTLAGGGGLSIDTRLSGHREAALAWPVFLLKSQVSIVYFFAAITKMNAGYISGETLGLQLHPGFWMLIPEEFAARAAMGLAVASIVIELALAFGLWWKRMRLPVIGTGLLFHFGLVACVIPSVSLQIFVFTLLMLALYPLFFDGAQIRPAGGIASRSAPASR
ncbi:MAG TPA: HTTM domain-containing protein [Candidatus Acidoferrales bacterium]